MQSITIPPISYLKGKIRVPGSKSISNRVILLSSLARGTTKLINIPQNKDIQHMFNFIKKIGIRYWWSKKYKICKIEGCIKKFNNNKKITIFCGNSGTVIRSLTAILSFKKNNIILTGENRIKKRPIKHLVNALKIGGGKIIYLEKQGYPPLMIKGGFMGGKIKINCSLSSQFLTALLIMSPLAPKDTFIKIIGKLTSKTYINITLILIKNFGVKIKNYNFRYFYIKGRQKYISPIKYYIEGDASSASYFLAGSLIKGKKIKITGIGRNSIQGDLKFCKIVKKMGGKIYLHKKFIKSKKSKLKGIKIDMNSTPDIVMTIAILALFAKGKTIIQNIFNLRIKECDRLKAMSNELKKIGANIKEGYDYIEIFPIKKIKNEKINTYNDHRIAMCFSLIALSNSPVTILNPKCVTKSFPQYFEILKKISYRK